MHMGSNNNRVILSSRGSCYALDLAWHLALGYSVQRENLGVQQRFMRRQKSFQFAKSQEVSNVRALQIFERKILLSI